MLRLPTLEIYEASFNSIAFEDSCRKFRNILGPRAAQKIYIESVTESQVSAMDVLEAKFHETSNNLPMGRNCLVN